MKYHFSDISLVITFWLSRNVLAKPVRLLPLHVGGVILLILGSIPNSADPMVVWFFSFSYTNGEVVEIWPPNVGAGTTNFVC